MTERWRRIKDLFERCLELEAVECAALLDRECGADAALRRDVLSLLASDSDGHSLREVVGRAAGWHAGDPRATPEAVLAELREAATVSPMSKLSRLTEFLDRLDDAQLHYTMTSVTEGAITVSIEADDERWEVEFAGDGDIEVRIFRTDGDIHDFSVTEELFEQAGD